MRVGLVDWSLGLLLANVALALRLPRPYNGKLLVKLVARVCGEIFTHPQSRA